MFLQMPFCHRTNADNENSGIGQNDNAETGEGTLMATSRNDVESMESRVRGPFKKKLCQFNKKVRLYEHFFGDSRFLCCQRV